VKPSLAVGRHHPLMAWLVDRIVFTKLLYAMSDCVR
jgi:hypothetical protein